MKRIPPLIRKVFFLLVLSLILGCNLPDSEVEESSPPPEDTSSPTATLEATPLPSPTVVHTDFPVKAIGATSFVGDQSSKSIASERRANADIYSTNLLERPFTANEMDYLDYLDLTRGELSSDPPFLYLTIFVEGDLPYDVDAFYGMEIDLDIDGRGDWLVYGLLPPSIEWTTEGVHVYRDDNNDVGGVYPSTSEYPQSTWDGYEEHVFNQGYGIDPDAAWIRRDPDHANRLQIAFKIALLGDNNFLWSIWTDQGMHQPSLFDYHDHFTLEEAGSPVLYSDFYPLKALFAVDNSCRWSFGFTPSGNEPGLCSAPPAAPVADAPPDPNIPPGSISGRVCDDSNYNNTCNSGEYWGGVTVRLGRGACPSGGYSQTSTNSSGEYSFSGLAPGTYCVRPVVDLSLCGYDAVSGSQRTVTVTSGGTTNVPNFIYQGKLC